LLTKVLDQEVEMLRVAWLETLNRDPREAFEKAAERFG